MDIVSPIFNAADYAAQRSDRWLFIALLIVFGVALYMVGKYFAKRYEALLTSFDAQREKYDASLTKFNENQTAVIRDLTVVLTRNTEALEGCQKALAEHSSSTSECRRLREEMGRRAVA